MQNKRDKKRKGPVEESKPDTTKNIGNLDEIIASQREREKNLYPVPGVRYNSDLCHKE